MDNPHPDDAGDQPESVNPVPDPSVDITRTTQWATVHNRASLDAGTAVTHHNMEALASLIQASQKMHLDDEKRIKKLEADNRIIKADLQSILRALGEDTASEAIRRSSMNSRRASLGSHTSSINGATGEDEDQNEDPADVALAKFIDGLETIDTYFESFILSSGKTPLIKYTNNLPASSQAFKEAANVQLAGFVSEQRASEMLEYLSLFDDKQLEEAYMAMSRRFNESYCHRA